MPEEREIIRRIREGDIKEFETLFRSSYISLVKYAGTLVKDRDTAEEIVQDLFVKIWNERKNLNIKSSLTGYLFRSVHNRCLHHLQHLKVVEKHAERIYETNTGIADEADGEINLKELEDKIARVLEKLPERCCKIFCMNRFEGLKYKEIAEKLSISVKTVEACMGKALKELRKIIED
ncbi:MAG TPA: RNA polymerase sigma-70 factor [Bacteroidales bacterium]|nr:RNA polymerase sigma-70 factor [Bacteroidales bacterium]HOK73937.1 RNA polymerase sigma-70 factor [Bacteroidales bacterium]HOM39552.1 RNA polymerase sigma-70 factor [Bacteroidales bacterium]HOU30829.1 RNA polymerase sigma-70 factor [Bacteroidales bacterium]HPP91934.1 RNA polymerase sigma-70 factor [Bacteroidales bacterium]